MPGAGLTIRPWRPFSYRGGMLPYNRWIFAALALLLAIALQSAFAAADKTADPKKPKPARPPRIHLVNLGAVRSVPYSMEGDPAGAHPGENTLRIRPLLVDTAVKDWTTGDPHDVTDRSFAVRRAMRINDALPGEKQEHWVWQRSGWELVDRATGHLTPLKLPDYNPAVSDVRWFRDYAAYCGVTPKAKQLYAVVSQVASRRPMLAKKLGPWDDEAPHPNPACAPATWQREPLRITFQADGQQPTSFDLAGASAVLEEGDDDDAAPAAAASKTP